MSDFKVGDLIKAPKRLANWDTDNEIGIVVKVECSGFSVSILWSKSNQIISYPKWELIENNHEAALSLPN